MTEARTGAHRVRLPRRRSEPGRIDVGFSTFSRRNCCQLFDKPGAFWPPERVAGLEMPRHPRRIAWPKKTKMRGRSGCVRSCAKGGLAPLPTVFTHQHLNLSEPKQFHPSTRSTVPQAAISSACSSGCGVSQAVFRPPAASQSSRPASSASLDASASASSHRARVRREWSPVERAPIIAGSPLPPPAVGRPRVLVFPPWSQRRTFPPGVRPRRGSPHRPRRRDLGARRAEAREARREAGAAARVPRRSAGADRQVAIHQRLGIDEVWHWIAGRLEVHRPEPS